MTSREAQQLLRVVAGRMGVSVAEIHGVAQSSRRSDSAWRGRPLAARIIAACVMLDAGMTHAQIARELQRTPQDVVKLVRCRDRHLVEIRLAKAQMELELEAAAKETRP